MYITFIYIYTYVYPYNLYVTVGCRPHLAQLLHISESDEDYEALASSSPVSG